MGKIGKCTNRNVLEYDVVWETILQSMGKHMTNEDDSSEMKVRILMMITCESAYKQWLGKVNNSAIPPA